MLNPDYLSACTESIVELYQALEDSIIEDMCRRLMQIGMSETTVQQIERLQEMGGLYNDIVKQIAGFTGKSQAEIKRLFEDAGTRSLEYDDRIYRGVGLDPLPINQSAPMLNILLAGMEKTNRTLSNLTLTTAISSKSAFTGALDLAYMQITSGAMPYTQAITRAVKHLADSGVSMIHYASGRRDKIDVAVRRAVLTGVNQTAARLQLARADEMGCDLVETSAHIGARPAHAQWQGQVFSRLKRKGYRDFSETGYGEIDGLCGVNCRHSFFPFFEGYSNRVYTDAQLEAIDEQTVRFDGKDIPAYDATQMQRAMERAIRQSKRELSAFSAAMGKADEATAAALKEQFTLSSVRLKRQEAELSDFERQTKLPAQKERRQVIGFGRSEAQKAVWANKQAKSVYAEREKAYNRAVQEMRANIAIGKQPLTVSPQKQARHLEGTAPADKSYIIGTLEDAQWLVNTYAGTGQFEIDKNGNIKPVEIIITDQRMGVAVYGDDRSLTSQYKIHYAKKNTHIVPRWESE